MKKILLNNFLSEDGKEAVKKAVCEAESLTSGEIKVLVVQSSMKPFLLCILNALDMQEAIEHFVEKRAVREFFRMGIDKTRGKTGVLIMISLDERIVNVKADQGINEKVAQGTWEETVEMIVEAIKSGKPEEGICKALKQVANLLAEHFPIKEDDKNEIPDNIEIEH